MREKRIKKEAQEKLDADQETRHQNKVERFYEREMRIRQKSKDLSRGVINPDEVTHAGEHDPPVGYLG